MLLIAIAITKAIITEIGTVMKVINNVLVNALGPVKERKVLSKTPEPGFLSTIPKTTP